MDLLHTHKYTEREQIQQMKINDKFLCTVGVELHIAREYDIPYKDMDSDTFLT